MHTHGVIHRDIKPENLLVTSDGHLKIADMGVAEWLEEPETEYITETEGTPAFLSPEAVSGKPFLGFPVDVWASGISFYMMLFGTLPFFSEVSELDLFRDIQNKPIIFPSVDELVYKIKKYE